MQKHGKSLDILSAFLVGVSIFCCNLGIWQITNGWS
jgi:DNA-binding transcriptional regulator of glucitol operon